MTPEEVQRHLEETGALTRGHFQLSSGLHSDQYIQCAKALSWPARASLLGAGIGALWVDDSVDLVVGPALGGVIIAHEVARYLGTPCFFAERKDGVMTVRRGFTIDPAARILVVEDVVTTGGSVKEVVKVLTAAGADVVGVSSIVWRFSEDEKSKSPFGEIPFRCLWPTEVPAWQPQECPACAAGQQIDKPGSRPTSRTADGNAA